MNKLMTGVGLLFVPHSAQSVKAVYTLQGFQDGPMWHLQLIFTCGSHNIQRGTYMVQVTNDAGIPV